MKTSSTSSSETGARSVPVALLIAILLALAFEWFQSANDFYFYLPSQSESAMKRAGIGSTPLRMRIKSHDAYVGLDPAEIVVLGDSSAYVGLVPEVLERKTGMTAYNYGTLMREGKLSSRLLLSNLVRKPETRPEIVVLCWTPFSLALLEPATRKLEYTYSHGNTRLLIEEFGFWGWVRSQLPTLRHQALLKSLVLDRVWPTAEDFESIDRAVALARENKGWLAYHQDRVHRSSEAHKRYAGRFLGEAPVVEGVDRQTVALLELARGHGIAVVAFQAPIVPESHRFYSMKTRWPVISGYLASLRDRYPEITLLDVQGEFMSDRYFSDTIHLNGPGSTKLSSMVAEAIAGLEAAGATRGYSR